MHLKVFGEIVAHGSKRALLEVVVKPGGCAIIQGVSRRGIWHVSRPKLRKGIDDVYFSTPAECKAFMESVHESGTPSSVSFKGGIWHIYTVPG